MEDMGNLKKLGRIIKSERNRMGYTQEKFSEKVEISQRYLLNIENAGQIPSFNVLVRIARELSLSIDDIIFPERNIEKDRKARINEKINRCNEANLKVVETVVNSLLDAQKGE